MNTKLIAALVVAVMAVTGAYFKGSHDKDAAWQIKWQNRNAAEATARAIDQAKQTQLANRMQAEKEEIERNAAAEKKKLAADLAAANRESDSLRKSFAAAVARINKGQGSGNDGGSKGGDAGNMPAVVFGEIDQRSGDLARYADELRGALGRCVAQYDRVRLASDAR